MTEVIELCKQLVNCKSYSGEEEAVARIIEAYGKAHFDDVQVDRLGNVCLVMNGSEAGKTILLDGHIDTVPVNDKKWQSDPFQVVETEDRLIGRGTSDMKGSVASMIRAAIAFKEDTNGNFKGRVVVSCSVHEETFEGIATREVSKNYRPDIVIIGEATDLNLNRGQRGRAEIVVETYGTSAHSSNPQAGVNAVSKMMDFLNEVKKVENPTHDILGEGILVLTDIISSPYPGKSVVPDLCRATFDRRTLVKETKESTLAPIQAILERLAKEDSDFHGKASYAIGSEKCYTGEVIEAERFFPAWLYDEASVFVAKSLAALHEVGIPSELSHYSFCTNGSHFAGEASIPTIGFGPSLERLAHIDNEYILKDQLIKASIGYQAIIKSLLS